MGQAFNDFSIALATGQSRRKAIRRFVRGAIGAALATALPGHIASAQTQYTAFTLNGGPPAPIFFNGGPPPPWAPPAYPPAGPPFFFNGGGPI